MRQALAILFEGIGNVREEWSSAHRPGASIIGELLRCARTFEYIEQRQGAAERQRHDEAVHESGRVGDWRRHESYVVGVDLQRGRKRSFSKQNCIVRVDRAFRAGFRARGEQHGDRIVCGDPQNPKTPLSNNEY